MEFTQCPVVKRVDAGNPDIFMYALCFLQKGHLGKHVSESNGLAWEESTEVLPGAEKAWKLWST